MTTNQTFYKRAIATAMVLCFLLFPKYPRVGTILVDSSFSTTIRHRGTRNMEAWEVQRLYKRHHEMTLEKREISKAQKELMAEVKMYLEEHPEGFDVELTDARERTSTYHVGAEEVTRATMDKNMIQYELDKKGIKVKIKDITPGLIAEMVEQGHLSAEVVRDYEDVNTHNAVKKKKVKRPLTINERGASA